MLAPEKTGEVSALINRGLEAARAGEKAAAERALRQAVELDPSSDMAWVWLASVQGDTASAVYCLERAVQANPANDKAGQTLEKMRARALQEQQGHAGPGPQTQPQTQVQQPSQPGPGGGVVPPAVAGEMGPIEVNSDWRWNTGQSGPLPHYQSGPLSDQGTGQSGPLGSEHGSGPSAPLSELSYEELKRRGIVAAKGGRQEEAKGYLLAAAEINDGDPETWHWLATVVDDPEDKQIALENVLTLDPLNQAAEAAMRENALHLAEVAANPQQYAQAQQGQGQGQQSHNSSPLAASQVDLRSGPLGSRPGESAGPGHSSLILSASQGSAKGRPPAVGELLGGAYMVMGVQQGSVGPEYAAWQSGTSRFFLLRPQKCEVDDLKKVKARYLVYQDIPYTIVALSTKGMSLRGFIGGVGNMPAELAGLYGQAVLRQLAVGQAKGPVVSARKQLTPDTVGFDSEGNILIEPGELISHSQPDGGRAWLAPELASTGTPSPTSDVYAAGSLMFYMITGSPPPGPQAMPRKQGGAITPEYFDGYPQIPAGLAKVLAIAMQPNPTDRYTSVKEMSSALADAGFKGAKGTAPFLLPGLLVVALLAGLAAVGWLGATGRINLPLLNNKPSQALAAPVLPTAEPQPPTATPIPPVPLGEVRAHTVDTRRFPSNSLFLSVMDTAGQPVPGLTSASVKITDNGAECNNLKMTELRYTTDPVSVIFAIDNSMTMAGRPLDDAKTALHIEADRLQPGDQMALMTYGGQGSYLVDYTVSKAQFLSAVDGIQPTGKPDLFPALRFAAERTATQPQGGYTALVVISNNPLPSSEPVILAATRAANLANLPVFILGLEQEHWTGDVANRIASATGGWAVLAEKADAGGASDALKKIDQRLHSVYKLTYDATSLDTQAEHTIDLTITSNDTTQSDTRKYWVLRR